MYVVKIMKRECTLIEMQIYYECKWTMNAWMHVQYKPNVSNAHAEPMAIERHTKEPDDRDLREGGS